MPLFAAESGAQRTDTSSTFAANVTLPVHRWFRYSAGFSALWVRDVLRRERAKGRTHILDPFAGSATVLLEAELAGVHGIGVEAHPFVSRIATAKLAWRADARAFRRHCKAIIELAQRTAPPRDHPSSLIMRCFEPAAIAKLNALRSACDALTDGSQLSQLAWLVLTSILRECAYVGTAQWQYVLPDKFKARVLDPFIAFDAKSQIVAQDMTIWQDAASGPPALLNWEDARACESVPEEWADLIITSPPYANNYDYADATRLEMTFFGEIQGWGDLQASVRKYLVRSCTQHVAPWSTDTYTMASDPILAPIRDELMTVCKALNLARLNHGGKKAYHTMIAAYFLDLAHTWVALRRIARRDSLVCFVIGDSAPYGVYVPVDRWLGELAVASGFTEYSFEKTRDRNIKWKNRKHRVPLHEGRLWVRG